MKRGPAMVGAVVLTVVWTGACQNMPGPFAPPVQRQPPEDFRAYRMQEIVEMSDEAGPDHFVKDITGMAAGSWRWTGKQPTVRVRMRTAENLRYTIDFAIAEATLRATGPVTLSFLVNDHVLERVRYARAGAQHFEKAVPPTWTNAGQDVTLAAQVDKVWIPPWGGSGLGIILVRIGLTQ